jgi:hypothetical protein
LAIVHEFTKYMRKDLWAEHERAMDFDYVFGIGLPDGYAIHGSDHRRMHKAAHYLKKRARAVRADPTMFSKYTVSFVNDLYENWPPLTRTSRKWPSTEQFVRYEGSQVKSCHSDQLSSVCK